MRGGAAEDRGDVIQGERQSEGSGGRVVAGRYELCEKLGAGGMGIVWRASDLRANADVAMKFVHAGERGRGSALALQHEFRSMSQLTHPNLVEVRNYGETDDGQPFFTMELVDGIDLDRAGQLGWDELRWVLAEIARALAFVHARGRIHRDLKPSNVRLIPAPEGQPGQRFRALKVMDLGTLGRQGVRPEAIAGTPSYLPPEAVFGGVLDQRSDLYSLGVIAYELSCGRLPRRVRSFADMAAESFQKLTDPRSIRPDLPEDLYLLTLDLLELDLAARPHDAFEVADRLGRPLSDVDAPEGRAYLTPSLCVGRSVELERLRTGLRTARTGKISCAIVRGPAGAGKTRLARDLLVEAKTDGAFVVEATCHDQTAAPFGLLQRLLEPLIAAPHAKKLLAEIEEAELLSRLLPEVSELKLPAAREYADAALVRDRMIEVACKWLAALSKAQHVVLAIDDLQWSDAGSLDALATLLRIATGARLFVLATERTSDDPPVDLGSDVVAIDLGPLRKDDVRELLHAMFGVEAQGAPPAMVDKLHVASQGNPYFLVELIRSLCDSGQIRRASGAWELSASPVFDRLPKSLEDALDRRFAKLSPRAREVADALCVLEAEPSTAACKELSRLANDALFDAIDELVAGEILVGAGDGYQFRHARCRERLYAALAPTARAARHLAAAEYLVTTGDEARAAEIGEHFAEAGDAKRAVEHLLRGAEQLWTAQAYADLRRPLELVRRLLDKDDPRLLTVLPRLARATFYTDHDGAVEHFRTLREHYKGVGVLRWLPRLSKVIGALPALVTVLCVSWITCRFRGPKRSFGELYQCLLELFVNTTFLCSSLAYAGRLTESCQTAAELEPFVVSKKQLPHGGRVIAEMTARTLQGRLDRAAALCREGLHVFSIDKKTPVDPYDRAVAVSGALTALSNSDLWRGRPAARETVRLLRADVEASDFFFVRALLHQATLWLAINHGSIEEAETEWNAYNALYRRVGHVPLVEVLNRLWFARALFAHDRLREAHLLASQVMQRKQENRYVRGVASEVIGLVNLAWGKIDEAEKCFTVSIDAGKDPAIDSPTLTMRGETGLGLCALARSRPEEAVGHADAALALALRPELTNEMEQAAAQRVLAMAEAARGRRAQALEAMAAAERLAIAMESPVQARLNQRALSRLVRSLCPEPTDTAAQTPAALPRRTSLTPADPKAATDALSSMDSLVRSHRTVEIEETISAGDAPAPAASDAPTPATGPAPISSRSRP